MNKPKKLSEQNGSNFLQIAFECEQNVLKEKLSMACKTISHNGKMGEVNEGHFIDIIKTYLPQRYKVDSATIIDSSGKNSDQIDIVIYDPQYTPTLLDQQGHKYIPIEAVYCIFEVKPTVNKEYLEYAADKAESVRKLKATSVPIPHAGDIYPAKPTINIVAGIIAVNVDWKDGFGKTFRKHHSNFSGHRGLDCGLAVSGYYFDTYAYKPGYTYEPSHGQALIFFLFRLLGKLQSMGTVPAIDWNAYADSLSKK